MTTELSLGPEDFVEVDDLYDTDRNATTKTEPQINTSYHESSRAQAIEKVTMVVKELVDSYAALVGVRERTSMPNVSRILGADVDCCTELHVINERVLVAWCVYVNGSGVIYRTRVPYDILKSCGLA